MRIRNKAASVSYKLLLTAVGVYGLLLGFGVFEGKFNLSMLNYFTVLSNLLCVVYFAADIVHIVRGGEGDVWFPPLKGIATMAITVTLLVAHFILGMRFTMAGSLSMTLIIMHYAVPLMTIADWLAFDTKGLIKPRSPLVWTIGPMLYFVYAMIAARIGDGIGYGSRYPYPFLDVDALGRGRVLLTVLVLVAFFVAIGYVYYGADRLLLRLGRKRPEAAGGGRRVPINK
jgi:hypothetical protein